MTDVEDRLACSYCGEEGGEDTCPWGHVWCTLCSAECPRCAAKALEAEALRREWWERR